MQQIGRLFKQYNQIAESTEVVYCPEVQRKTVQEAFNGSKIIWTQMRESVTSSWAFTVIYSLISSAMEHNARLACRIKGLEIWKMRKSPVRYYFIASPLAVGRV